MADSLGTGHAVPAPNPHSGAQGILASAKKQCCYCRRQFAKTDHLERHLRSHTKEKPFLCTVCGRRYSRSYGSLSPPLSVTRLVFPLTVPRSDSLFRHQSVHRRPKRKQGQLKDNEPLFSSFCEESVGQRQQTVNDQSANNPVSATSAYFTHSMSREPLPDPSLATINVFNPPYNLLTRQSADSSYSAPATRISPMTQGAPAAGSGQIDLIFNQHNYPTPENGCPTLLDQPLCANYEVGAVWWDDVDSVHLNSYLFGTSFTENNDVPVQLPEPDFPNNGPTVPQRQQPASKAGAALVIVEKRWFTRFENENDMASDLDGGHVSGVSTPSGENRFGRRMNDSYRQSLANRLRPKWSDHPLPSTEFLVRIETLLARVKLAYRC